MVEFRQTLAPTEAEIETVLGVIVGNLAGQGRDTGYQPFGILLHDAADQAPIGGLTGYVIFEWLFIHYVGVPDSLRGQGVGTELLRQTEAWCREQGLAGMWLDTFAFQARPFYEKLGFSVFGEILDHPRGSSRFFMQKRLI